MENITDIRRHLYNCLEELGTHPNISICIIKYIDGSVDLSERQAILDDAFSSLCAEKIEGIKDDNLISISGYSKNFDYCIKSGSRDININAACRYSTYDNRTYFWLGTPVITFEY
jgi:hypothetical protein